MRRSNGPHRTSSLQPVNSILIIFVVSLGASVQRIDHDISNGYSAIKLTLTIKRSCACCVGVLMAPRAYWKGYLKLSLVSCPIALYPASSSSERGSFNRINKKTGSRLKQQNVDAETSEPVDREDIVRGYEIGKGEYLIVEDEELEKIQIESTHTIAIDSFVPRSEIDDRYLDSPYYITPTDQVGQEAFAVIRDAIRDRGMVGLGRVVLSRRERVMMLEAFGKSLLATSLRYGYEVRNTDAYFG